MKGMLVKDGDLCVSDGTLAIGNTECDVIEHVLMANRGEFRENPLLGGEIRKMQHGIGSRMWCARAKAMCRAAGVHVSKVSVEDNNIRVE